MTTNSMLVRALAGTLTFGSIPTAGDPLPSWKDSAPKRTLVIGMKNDWNRVYAH